VVSSYEQYDVGSVPAAGNQDLKIALTDFMVCTLSHI
jgi:hypothetical protein